MAFSVSGGKGRRWIVSGDLPDTDAYVWVHAADDRDRHREKDKAEPADSLRETAAEVGISRRAGMSCASHYPAVLLRDRRMGGKIFSHVFDWQRH